MKQIPINTKFDAQVVTITRIRLMIGDDLHEMTYDQARRLFSALSAALAEELKGASVNPIISLVSREFGISREQILSKDRREMVSRARQTAMYLARELTNGSLEQIGRSFGLDHGTVLHAHRKVAGFINAYPSWSRQIERLKIELATAYPVASEMETPMAFLPMK